MTRINTVPPEVLTTKHLFAEWRELPRIFTVVKKHIANGKSVKDFEVPSEYKLGKGHVTFFYDKLFWLIKRYWNLNDELLKRNHKASQVTFRSVVEGTENLIDTEWWNDWKPGPKAHYINMARLVERSEFKEDLDSSDADMINLDLW